MEGDWLHATLNIDKDVMRTLDWVDNPKLGLDEDLHFLKECDTIVIEELEK